VGAAQDGTEAITLVRDLKPDVLLLDLAMPRAGGLDVLRALSTQSLSTRTIVFTAAIDTPEIVTALNLGMRGVVLKDAPTDLLIRSIHAVMAGELWVGREELASWARAAQQPAQKRYGLTGRELEIIDAIKGGAQNRHIADQFGITEETVKRHLSNIYEKLGVSNRLELALFALHNNLGSAN
jgi:two-component system, NarL family, nitrate/nitrite response regulator NarL